MGGELVSRCGTELFHGSLSRSTIFTDVSLNCTGRLVQLIVQGSSLFSVISQDYA